MHKVNDGRININGSVAYVPQLAWIQNATVKNNIIFGGTFNSQFYNSVVKNCSLSTDFEIMPAGDQTEIGEKGINLSGGQKQRISLARAVYSNADIYMLDDPLSAVDSHVGKDIFDSVIGPNGMLKEKTRLFVTNSLSFLPQVDQIIMIDNGAIVEAGTYDELKKKEGQFAEFIKNYLANAEASKGKAEDLNESTVDPSTPTAAGAAAKSDLPSGSVKSLNRTSSSARETSPPSKENDKLLNNTVEDKKEKTGEKIIQKEKIESGKVKFSVLMQYFRAGGVVFTSFFIFLFSLGNFLGVGSNFWLAIWTNRAKTSEPDRKFFYFGIFSLIGLCQCLVVLASDLVFVLMTIKASVTLHDSMLFSILRSTMEFFESTPIGRIINRFSKDVEAVEKNIPEAFKPLCRCVFHVFFTCLVISYSTPWFLVTLVPIVIIYFLVQRYFVSSMRQLKVN